MSPDSASDASVPLPPPPEDPVEKLYRELELKIREYRPKDDLAGLEKAFHFARKYHEGQKRDSGEPYMIHPLMVAHILADMRMDVVAMQTGLLHDVVEDTSVTVEQVRKEFGEEVARCVDGVTKLSKLDFFSAEDRQAESFRKMLLAMVEDIRVILVKLADRMHNMRTLGYLEPRTARAHRPRDHRDLRAHRAPPGHGQGARRTGGSGLPVPGAGRLPGNPPRHGIAAPLQRGVPGRDPPDSGGRDCGAKAFPRASTGASSGPIRCSRRCAARRSPSTRSTT